MATQNLKELKSQFLEYLEIEKEFNPPDVLGTEDRKEVVVNRAVVHSKDLKFSFQSSCLLTKTPTPSGNPQINVNITSNRWTKI